MYSRRDAAEIRANAFAMQATQIDPDQRWVVSENLTLDFFPIQATPLSKRGMFSWYVAKLRVAGVISLDTAATYLEAPVQDLQNRLDRILELRQ